MKHWTPPPLEPPEHHQAWWERLADVAGAILLGCLLILVLGLLMSKSLGVIASSILGGG